MAVRRWDAGLGPGCRIHLVIVVVVIYDCVEGAILNTYPGTSRFETNVGLGVTLASAPHMSDKLERNSR